MQHYHPPIIAIISGILGLFAMGTDLRPLVAQAAPTLTHDWVRDAINLGGMGMFALAMLMLHREAIKSFGEKLSEMMRTFTDHQMKEREENRKLWEAFTAMKLSHHAEVMAELRQRNREER